MFSEQDITPPPWSFRQIKGRCTPICARRVGVMFSVRSMRCPPWSVKHNTDGIILPLDEPFRVGASSSR